MDEYYELRFNSRDYLRILKLIENDEANRIKARERSRAKATKPKNTIREKIHFDVIKRYKIDESNNQTVIV